MAQAKKADGSIFFIFIRIIQKIEPSPFGKNGISGVIVKKLC